MLPAFNIRFLCVFQRNLQVSDDGDLEEDSRKCILDGPISILKQKIDDKKLQPDDHQTQVVNDLQKLYEKVKTYEPKGPAGGFSKWLSFGKKEEKTVDIQGLYIYGSVGGGKTMLVRELITSIRPATNSLSF